MKYLKQFLNFFKIETKSFFILILVKDSTILKYNIIFLIVKLVKQICYVLKSFIHF